MKVLTVACVGGRASEENDMSEHPVLEPCPQVPTASLKDEPLRCWVPTLLADGMRFQRREIP
jgi:hypothetical protein